MEYDFDEINHEFKNDMANIDGSKLGKTYAGLEKRLSRRRKRDDRRNNLRFEPGKCIDRREHCDRRIVSHNYQPTVN
jgi:hypothetical protein